MCTNVAPKHWGENKNLISKKIVIIIILIKLQIVFIIIYKYTHTCALNGELLKNKNNNYDQLMTEVCVVSVGYG